MSDEHLPSTELDQPVNVIRILIILLLIPGYFYVRNAERPSSIVIGCLAVAFLGLGVATVVEIVNDRSACTAAGGDPTTVKTWSGLYKTICEDRNR